MKPEDTPLQISESFPPWLMFPDMSLWESVFAYGKYSTWRPKENLYTVGVEADEILLITDGLVQIVAIGLNGVPRSIGILGPGSILGEAAFFHDAQYKHDIVCTVACEGYIFGREQVMEHILSQKHLAYSMLRNLAQKSYMMSTQLECLSFMSSTQLIANYLHHLGKEQEKKSWIYEKLASLSLTTMAELIGLHRVTVTNIVNAMKKDGILSGKDIIRIEDPAALLALLRK